MRSVDEIRNNPVKISPEEVLLLLALIDILKPIVEELLKWLRARGKSYSDRAELEKISEDLYNKAKEVEEIYNGALSNVK